MSALDEMAKLVERGMREIAEVVVHDDAVRITTHCMYPSNGLVRVTIRGGRETIVASDEGEAVGEALSAGIQIKDSDRLLRSVVKTHGLLINKGIIHTPPMPISSTPLAILLVANTAADSATWLYGHMKLKRDRDFRRLLADFLRKKFDERWTHDAKIVGASSKTHKFANLISFPNGRRLIVDPVANDPSSINARVVANLDIKSTNDPMIEQRIIYDDEEDWSKSDLNLLNVGATVVPFSKADEVIQRIAQRVQAA